MYTSISIAHVRPAALEARHTDLRICISFFSTPKVLPRFVRYIDGHEAELVLRVNQDGKP